MGWWFLWVFCTHDSHRRQKLVSFFKGYKHKLESKRMLPMFIHVHAKIQSLLWLSDQYLYVMGSFINFHGEIEKVFHVKSGMSQVKSLGKSDQGGKRVEGVQVLKGLEKIKRPDPQGQRQYFPGNGDCDITLTPNRTRMTHKHPLSKFRKRNNSHLVDVLFDSRGAKTTQ